MLPDRVSNPGPLTYESGALPIALRGPAHTTGLYTLCHTPSECVPGINRDWLIETPYLSVKYQSS